MLGLAIHTSSPQLGLMLQGTDGSGEPVSRYQVWDLGREVSSHLHVKMVEFMAPYPWNALSFIAVAKGPGGFTGTRIGVVAARTLAQQLAIPLFGVSSLMAIGATEFERLDGAEKDLAVTLAAKRDAVFGAVYRPMKGDDCSDDFSGDFTIERADDVVLVADWSAQMAQWPQPFVSIDRPAGDGLAASVQGVMKVAIARYRKGDRPDWSSVMPFYGQHPVHR